MIVESSDRLDQFVDFFQAVVCRSCWQAHHPRSMKHHHHGGLLYQLARAAKVSRAVFDRWVADEEHGLVHGVCTAYQAFWQHDAEQRQALWNDVMKTGCPRARNRCLVPLDRRPMAPERLMIACLFHDLLKPDGHFGHDRGLAAVFPDLDEAVYYHAAPRPQDEQHPLVAADRLELLRYPDHAEWVTWDALAPYLDFHGRDLALHFYRWVRPAVARLVRGVNANWALHGVEHAAETAAPFYPSRWWVITHIDRPSPWTGRLIEGDGASPGSFACSLGMLPTDGCHSHFIDRGPQSIRLAGVIPVERVKQLGCEFVAAPNNSVGRDHTFLKFPRPIPLSEWTFGFSNPADLRLIDSQNAHVIRLRTMNRLVDAVRQFLAVAEAILVK